MHILITGAAGMLGRKLVARLISEGGVLRLTLADIVKPDHPGGFAGDFLASACDISDQRAVCQLVADKPDLIYHLAAIVSGEAERDFDKGYRINLDGTRHLLEAVRAHDDPAYCPRFVFSSSIAVYGGDLPEVIEDNQRLMPASSYGVQKAMGELMVADFTRKGFIDGLSLRLPTITVRPGKPNKAASSFYSGIIREPLNGMAAILPVPKTVRHWFASPRTAVDFLVHAGKIDLDGMPAHRALSLPGVSASVGEMIAALERMGGQEVVNLIREEPDELVQKVVMGWPKRFNPVLAEKLGFRAETSFDAIIRAYLDDDFAK